MPNYSHLNRNRMSHYQNRRPRHTNLPDEIMTTEDSCTDRIIVAVAYLAAIVIPLAAVLIIGEQTGLISKIFGTV